jgi:hypothetical protein
MYLVYLLMGAFRHAKSETRIVLLSSLAHKRAKMHWDDLDARFFVMQHKISVLSQLLSSFLVEDKSV